MNDMILWSPGVTLESIEKEVILRAFRHYRGNKTATANSLGIAVRTLDNKLEKYEADGKLEEERKENERHRREEFLARQRGHVTTNRDGGSIIGASSVPGAHESNGAATASQAKASENGNSVSAGVRVESAAKVGPQQNVPLPQRKEVQGVSPRPATKSGHR